jgi:predicted nucleotide-binding protein (sugar kinase/HSP70/actin superfamily)
MDEIDNENILEVDGIERFDQLIRDASRIVKRLNLTAVEKSELRKAWQKRVDAYNELKANDALLQSCENQTQVNIVVKRIPALKIAYLNSIVEYKEVHALYLQPHDVLSQKDARPHVRLL